MACTGLASMLPILIVLVSMSSVVGVGMVVVMVSLASLLLGFVFVGTAFLLFDLTS